MDVIEILRNYGNVESVESILVEGTSILTNEWIVYLDLINELHAQYIPEFVWVKNYKVKL